MKRIKICGIRTKNDILAVNEYVPDYIGFIFVPSSKRYITPEVAEELKRTLSPDIQVCGVFVNENPDKIIAIAQKGIIDYVQLHGDESIEFITCLKQRIPHPIIKAVRVRNKQSILEADCLPCDYLLFDTYQKDAYGGTGKNFSWDLIPEKINHPYFLAGGLNETNINTALKIPCFAYDISGGVESNGKKDSSKICNIIKQIRKEAKLCQKEDLGNMADNSYRKH